MMSNTTLNVLNLRHLVTPRSCGSACPADCLFLCLPPVTSRLKLSDHIFRNAAPHVWNNLPPSLRSFASCNSTSPTTFSFNNLHSAVSSVLSCLKTHLFTLSYLAFSTLPSPFSDVTGGMIECN